MYEIVYTTQAKKDYKKIKDTPLHGSLIHLLNLIQKNPYTTPPSYEKLGGSMSGAISRRINVQHRLVYEVIESEKVIKIIRMWTHYD